MMGKLGPEQSSGADSLCELAGVIPRFCVDLFRQTASAEYQTGVQVSSSVPGTHRYPPVRPDIFRSCLTLL